MNGKHILVYCNDDEKLSNLVNESRKIAGLLELEKVLLVVTGPDAAQKAKELDKRGIDQIIAVETPDPFPETDSAVVAEIAQKYDAKVVAMLHKPFEVEVAARVGAKLNTGCVINCLKVTPGDSGNVNAEKMLYGGVVAGNMEVSRFPFVCTINENVCRDRFDGDGPSAEIVRETVTVKKSGKKLIETRPVEQTVNLKNAEKIVSFGRGIAKQEDISLIEELAKALNAQIGCSRPIVEDFKWMKLERQVGLTGTTVAPKLYLAVGISGQIQHVVGIKDAEVIVAINNNRNAPIFDVADYGVVGDLYEIVPKLTEMLNRLTVR